MRFLALFKKEFRETLPWVLLAGFAFLVLGGFLLRGEMYNSFHSWQYRRFEPGSTLGIYAFMHLYLSSTGIWLFLSSIALGLMLGIRQFWIPGFTREWGFTIHRSVTRLTILFSKLITAATVFLISLGVIWALFYYYATLPEVFRIPPPWRVFSEGWIFILIGFIVYLGTSLSGLSSARWYTTKIFGLASSVVVLLLITMQWKISCALLILLIGGIILLAQIVDVFLNREF